MESLNPSYKYISQFASKYPKLVQPLLQTYHDLSLSQKWFSLECKEVKGHVVILGRKTNTHQESIIIPVHLHSNLSIEWLNSIMNGTEHAQDPQYLAISSSDGTVVYYRLKLGLMKPDDLRVV